MLSCLCRLETGSEYWSSKRFRTPPKSSHARPIGWTTVTLRVVAAETVAPESVSRELRYCPSTDTVDRGEGPRRLNRACAM
jgi:hypothetical protein